MKCHYLLIVLLFSYWKRDIERFASGKVLRVVNGVELIPIRSSPPVGSHRVVQRRSSNASVIALKIVRQNHVGIARDVLVAGVTRSDSALCSRETWCEKCNNRRKQRQP